MLDGDILVPHLLHFSLGLRQHGSEAVGDIGLLVAAGDLRQAGDGTLTGILYLAKVEPQLAHQLADKAVFLTDQGAEQVNLLHLRVAIALGELLRALQRLHGFLGETVRIHPNHPPLCSGRQAVR